MADRHYDVQQKTTVEFTHAQHVAEKTCSQPGTSNLDISAIFVLMGVVLKTRVAGIIKRGFCYYGIRKTIC